MASLSHSSICCTFNSYSSPLHDAIASSCCLSSRLRSILCPQFVHRSLLLRIRTLTKGMIKRDSSRVMMLTMGRYSTTADVVQHDQMEGATVPPLPQNRIVVGCGSVSVDYLASVEEFPQPDEKIRSTDLKVQGGGNVGNACTAAAKLGLKPRIISKVANDVAGRLILDELDSDGVDTSHIIVSETGTSPFTYVIVDRQMNTRTCIHSPGSPPLHPHELSSTALDAALSGASIAYFDGRLFDTALIVAKEAAQRHLPILLDAERIREGMDEFLVLANYVVCSSKFPQAWTKASSLPEALLEMLFQLPQLKFVIATLGASGCVMLEKASADPTGCDVMDVNLVYDSLSKEIEGKKKPQPFVLSSRVGLLSLKHDGGTTKEIMGRMLVGTAEAIPPSEIVDTTGSGDAFIGSVLYSLCAHIPPERMLVLGAAVAGANCRALGARAGLLQRDNSRVIAFI